MTNFEKIKQMSVDDLARLLVFYDGGYGVFSGEGIDDFCSEKNAISAQIKWLESEADNE